MFSFWNGSQGHIFLWAWQWPAPTTLGIVLVDAVLLLFSPHPLLGAHIHGSKAADLTEQTLVWDHGRVRWVIVIGLPHHNGVTNPLEIELVLIRRLRFFLSSVGLGSAHSFYVRLLEQSHAHLPLLIKFRHRYLLLRMRLRHPLVVTIRGQRWCGSYWV